MIMLSVSNKLHEVASSYYVRGTKHRQSRMPVARHDDTSHFLRNTTVQQLAYYLVVISYLVLSRVVFEDCITLCKASFTK
jgi:hypothetical protein